VGVYTAAVTFLPTDFSNYNTLAGEVDVTVLPLPPAAPTGLSAVGSPGQVDLSWNASASATSYNVKRSMTQGSGYVTVGSPSSTSFSDPVANGATYYYVVSAVNAGGESPNSGEASVMLLHVLPFSEDFEALDIGDLDGQRFWSATNALVQTNVAYDVKAASITSEEGYASHLFAGNDTNVWTDLKVQVVFSESEPSGFGADPATVLYFNTNGNPVAFSGTNAVVVSGTTVSSGAWVRVTIHSDYVQKTWNLYIDDQEVATDLGFYSAARPYYSELRVQGADSTQFANIDDILIDTVSPLAPPVYYSFIVNSLYGAPTPSGTNLLTHGSTVNFAIAGTPEIIPSNTMYEAIGWERTGSSPATGTTTNDSFVITNNTTLIWQWQTNYWIELNTAGE
jgi:hypothetical protein